MQSLPRAEELRLAQGRHLIDAFQVAEVAIALDIAPGAVKTRPMHARTQLRALLEGDGNGQV
jgi:DNA-directed RNA polymerase specialized sigma24 family protein